MRKGGKRIRQGSNYHHHSDSPPPLPFLLVPTLSPDAQICIGQLFVQKASCNDGRGRERDGRTRGANPIIILHFDSRRPECLPFSILQIVRSDHCTLRWYMHALHFCTAADTNRIEHTSTSKWLQEHLATIWSRKPDTLRSSCGIARNQPPLLSFYPKKKMGSTARWHRSLG